MVTYRWSGWRLAHDSNLASGWWTAHINGRNFVSAVGVGACAEYDKGDIFQVGYVNIDDLCEDGRLSYCLMGAPTEDDLNAGFAVEKKAALTQLEVFMTTAWMTPKRDMRLGGAIGVDRQYTAYNSVKAAYDKASQFSVSNPRASAQMYGIVSPVIEREIEDTAAKMNEAINRELLKAAKFDEKKIASMLDKASK